MELELDQLAVARADLERALAIRTRVYGDIMSAPGRAPRRDRPTRAPRSIRASSSPRAASRRASR
jgi:hypothetical protein